MKFAIIGIGAVGGYYGGLLARSGQDVHFLLHSDYLHVKTNGLIVDSKDGDFVLPQVNAYSRAKDMPLCDVTIVSLKTTHNYLLEEILPLVVKKNGIVVMLQNGLGIERDAAQIVPNAIVVGGLCFLCSNKVGPGHVKHLDYGVITLGEYAPDCKPAGITPSVQFLSHEFEHAGITVKQSANLGEARWKKLVWNVPFNGLSVVLNATTEQLMDCQDTRRLAKDVMIEVITGAEKCGYPLGEGCADEMLRLTEQMTPYKPSMNLDYEAGRPLEIEKMYWRPIAQAESAGYIMHSVRTLASQLEYLDMSSRARSSSEALTEAR